MDAGLCCCPCGHRSLVWVVFAAGCRVMPTWSWHALASLAAFAILPSSLPLRWSVCVQQTADQLWIWIMPAKGELGKLSCPARPGSAGPPSAASSNKSQLCRWGTFGEGFKTTGVTAPNSTLALNQSTFVQLTA